MSGSDPKPMCPDPSRSGPEGLTRFWLRYGSVEVPLRAAWVLIGRSPSCDLILEDGSVSREHARIAATDEGVMIEDLSTNGVFIDGVRVAGRRILDHAAMITIGRHELYVVVADEIRSSPPATMPEPPESSSRPTMPGVEPSDAAKTKPGSRARETGRSGAHPARRVTTVETDAVALLGSVAERLIADGRVDAAERLMTPRMLAILADAQSSKRIAIEHWLGAVRLAIKLAAATRKQRWVEYAFELSTIGPHTLPMELVDQLYTLVRRIPPIRLAVLYDYIAALNCAAGRLTPNERFALQRLRGLAKLALSLGHG